MNSQATASAEALVRLHAAVPAADRLIEDDGMTDPVAPMTPEEFDVFLRRLMLSAYDLLADGGAIYVAHSEAGDGMAFRKAFKARVGQTPTAFRAAARTAFLSAAARQNLPRRPISNVRGSPAKHS